MTEWMDELAAWWAALAPEWAFLMLLPLLVGAVGLLVEWGMREASPQRRAEPVRRRGQRQRGSH